MRSTVEEFEQRVTVLGYPKLRRWMTRPMRYLSGLSQRYIMNDVFHLSSRRRCEIFTGHEISVILPSGLDLYLTGIKTHDSEVRLVRFILNELPRLTEQPIGSSVAVDCGAHLGYFSLVLSQVFGRVISFEPTSAVFPLLKDNVKGAGNIDVRQVVVSDSVEETTFREMPIRYSEYNTAIEASVPEYLVDQVIETRRQATTLDDLCKELGQIPAFVKIDVEGGEVSVLRGAVDLLRNGSTIFAFEVRLDRYDELYAPLFGIPQLRHYELFGLGAEGNLVSVDNPASWIGERNLESDNFLFVPQ